MVSLRRRTLMYLALLSVPLALGVLVPVTLIQNVLQHSVQMYQRNQQYQLAAEYTTDLEAYLQAYLQTKSTDSLRLYLESSSQLADAQKMFNPLMPKHSVQNRDQLRYMERTAFHLIMSLQYTANRVVQAKRGRSPEMYVELFHDVREIASLLREVLIQLSQQELTRVMQTQEVFSVHFDAMQMYSFGFLVSLMLLTVVLASYFSGLIVAPIVKLAASALRLADGDFSAHDIPLQGSNEVQQMAYAFNRMKHSLQSYIRELQHSAEIEKGLMEERVANLKMKNVLKQAEMAALQSQIHPHFLFNALNTGVQLATIEDAERTSEYLDLLAQLFRETLRPLSESTTLGREFDTLKTFLHIMQIRFGTEVRMIIDCNPVFLRIPLPRLILQPLVENSVVHGFNNGSGTVNIAVEQQQSDVLIVLTDNGSGMGDEQLQQLQYEIETMTVDIANGRIDPRGAENGIGLRNVMYRLRLFTGRIDSFTISSVQDNGVSICIRVPLSTARTTEEDL